MDPNEQTTPEVEADTALSPSETDGASSSDAADEAPKTAAEAILSEFKDKYGEDDEGDELEASDGEEGTEPDASTAPDAQDQEPEEDQAAPEGTDDSDDAEYRIPDEEFKSLSDGVKKRIGQLTTRVKKAERDLADRGREMEPLKEAHERFTTLQNFVNENGIEPQNVTLAFNAMAQLSHGDYEGFLQSITPWVTHAQQAAGKAISPDLQQRVDDGYLSEEDAIAMTKDRIRAQTLQGQNEALTRRQQADQQRQQITATEQQITQAIDAREATLKASDPDYAHKSPAIMRILKIGLERGARPKTAEDAVKMVDDAYEAVNATFTRPKPPKPTPPRPTESAKPTGLPEPKNSHDAIMQALITGPQ